MQLRNSQFFVIAYKLCFTIEGTWKDGVFTSAKALDGVKEGGLVKVRLTAKGSDGPCFGVKMTNNYQAPKTDAKK